jgi:hypothetical protein
MVRRPMPIHEVLYEPRDGPRVKGYDCADDGAMVLVVGTIFFVLAIMAGPAGVLAMAFWEGLALWGGLGAGAWALGHATVCPF